jgi:transcriptional regulator with PAS, ATPase and Fis domain
MVMLRPKELKDGRKTAVLPVPGLSAENLWEALFNSPHERLIVVNGDGLVGRISPSLADVFHRKPEDFIGRPIRYNCRCFQKMNTVISSGDAEYGVIESIGAESVLVDYIPVKNKGKVAGVMARLQLPGEVKGGGGGIMASRDRRKQYVPGHTVKYTAADIIGPSPQMAELKDTLLRVALRDSNILITGESGTGKELFAQAIHDASLRKGHPFIKINCAAIPESLLESEFFGYEEGTFTGSKKGGRRGKLELADRGTVFLDEIGDLSFPLQAKLLRFIQDREIQKLGGSDSIKSDVRIVAATNISPDQLVRSGGFREDLYFRLNVVNINVPPLRERMEDIIPLAEHFIEKFNRVFKCRVAGLSDKTVEILKSHNWPGNVRELENIVERAFNVLDGNMIMPHHLPVELLDLNSTQGQAPDDGPVEFAFSALAGGQNMDEILARAEKTVILQALSICRGNKAKAAKMLGISRPGLYKKMVKLVIE